MKQVKYIELVLENCEVIKIQREHLGKLIISDIKKSICRIACNSISDLASAEDIYIQISSKANEQSSYICSWQDGEVDPFKRIIEQGDITGIDIKYEDDSDDYIHVNWNEDSEYINSYQTSAINEHTGDLYLVISEKDTAESYFADRLQEKQAKYWTLYS